MNSKVLYSICLCFIFFSIGCSGITNSMRTSEKNSPWNPIQKISRDGKEKKKIGFRLNTHLIRSFMCLTIDFFYVF